MRLAVTLALTLLLAACAQRDPPRQSREPFFNPASVEGLMCRHQLHVGWDGTLYDCDFNFALGLPVNPDAPGHISRFDPATFVARRIATGEHCYGCTAGAGSSCGGALV